MESISKKSLSILIDDLITTSLKTWMAQETVMKETDPSLVAAAAKQAQSLNARRNKLMRAIDEYENDIDGSPTEKTYA